MSILNESKKSIWIHCLYVEYMYTNEEKLKYGMPFGLNVVVDVGIDFGIAPCTEGAPMV